MSGGAVRVPRLADLDVRLVEGIAQTARELTCVVTEHDTPVGSRCPLCGWQTSRERPACPSAVVARAIRDRRPVPEWLGGLAVPGLPPRATRRTSKRAELDALPGLFPVPARGRRTA